LRRRPRLNCAIFRARPCFGVRRVFQAAHAATRVLCRSVLGWTGHGPIQRQSTTSPHTAMKRGAVSYAQT
jgi:hypothetical protein